VSTPPFVDLPSGVRPVSLRTGRGPLAALRADARGERRGTVVLVPGFTGSKEDFIAAYVPLAERGWTAVGYDQRGQYESPGPDEESAYSLGALATDLLEVAAQLGPEPVHLVGHSFGGLVAREAALACGGQHLASLVLLCSGPAALPPSHHDALGAVRAALPQVPLETVYDVKEAADREGGWVPPSPEVAEFMRRRFVRTNPWSLRAKASTLLDTPDRTGELAALAAAGLPVAVVYGPADDAWPVTEQDRVARALGVSAVAVPGCGHSPLAEEPERAVAVLDEVLSGLAARRHG
jgi:pimeloyl-ACP methyl ester carboxylesterase